MSVDTRTPRSPSGGRSPGFDEDVLNTLRVPSDPAQVVVSHASFRVKLGASASPPRFGADGITVMPHGPALAAMTAPAATAAPPAPVLPTSVRSAAEARTRRRRAAPVVWSGHTEPGDPAATQLLQAVRGAGATQVLPRVTEELLAEEPDDGLPPVRPAVVAPRTPPHATPHAPGAGAGTNAPGAASALADTIAVPRVGGSNDQASDGAFGQPRDTTYDGTYDRTDDRTYDIRAGRPFGQEPERGAFGGYDGGHGGAYDDGHDGRYGEPGDHDDYDDYDEDQDEAGRRYERRRGEPVRHAWYPGRRMNLGVVLLPLRVFLGFICVYAGLGKLCDPVYFDGGARGSMVHWLASLHPWSVAEPLRSAAIAHPVGAGLTVAFLQVLVGVLTVMGLWQRLAAGFGALLSAALLVTVSWRTVPVYDAPDIIYLAAWSPLVIAGAPVYSLDSKLAGEAWRSLGPRAPLWQLRRYVVRRGVVLATLVAGGALVVGALFGSAVRASSSHLDTPATPSDLPTNDLPGSPYPQTPGAGDSGAPGRYGAGTGSGTNSPSPGASSSTGASPSASNGASLPGYTGHRGLPSQEQTVQAPRPPATPAHPAAPPAPASPTGGSSGSGSSGGSLGGLLGIKPSSGFLLGMRDDTTDGIA
jgi:uncharacterized membrane protein YphA (DoxX/SURF4 family)